MFFSPDTTLRDVHGASVIITPMGLVQSTPPSRSEHTSVEKTYGFSSNHPHPLPNTHLSSKPMGLLAIRENGEVLHE